MQKDEPTTPPATATTDVAPDAPTDAPSTAPISLVTSYDPAFRDIIVRGVARGESARAIAEGAGWCPASVHVWIARVPELVDALPFALLAAADYWADRASALAAIPGGTKHDRAARLLDITQCMKRARCANPALYSGNLSTARKAPAAATHDDDSADDDAALSGILDDIAGDPTAGGSGSSPRPRNGAKS